MNKKFFALAAVAVMSMAATSCGNDDTSLKCDDTYKSECLSDTHYMACTNGVLTTYECVSGEMCNADSMCTGEIVVAECTESVCKNDGVLNKCVDGKIQVVSCDPNTCADGACTDIVDVKKGVGEACVSKDECKGDLICDVTCQVEVIPECTESVCLDGDTLNSCVDGKIVVVDCDPYTCAAGACTTIVDDRKDVGEACANTDECKDGLICDVTCQVEVIPECTESVCLNGGTLNSCVDGKIVAVDCDPYTCAAGACTTIIDPCKGVTCTGGGTCNLGVCVPKNANTIKNGDACDETFMDFCRGSEMLYCSTDSKVVVTDCSSAGGCSIVAEEYEGDIYYSSWCKGPAEQCKAEEDEVLYCIDDEVNDYSFESYYYCMLNTEGEYTAMDMNLYGEYNECDGYCNDEMTACSDEVAPTSCDYNDKCVGDVHWSCFEFWGLVFEDEEDCTEEGGKCVLYSGEGTCGKACSVESSSTAVCKFDPDWGDYYLEVTTCATADDDNLYDVISYLDCEHGCNDDNTACKLLVEDEGDACDASFDERCDGEIVVYCDAEYGVVALDCAQAGLVCGMIDDISDCYAPCSDVGDLRRVCAQDYVGSYEVELICTADDEDKLIDVEVDGSIVECEGPCNAEKDACKDVELCNNTFVERCDDEVVVYCYDGIVDKIDCAEYGVVCGMIDGISDCYRSCTEEGPGQICGLTTDDSYAEVQTTCVKDDKSKLIKIIDDSTIEICPGNCNAEETACAL